MAETTEKAFPIAKRQHDEIAALVAQRRALDAELAARIDQTLAGVEDTESDVISFRCVRARTDEKAQPIYELVVAEQPALPAALPCADRQPGAEATLPP